MDNIVNLGTDRPRPYRSFGVPRSGARILFFTGVRYCRDDVSAAAESGSELMTAGRAAPSERMLDAATH